MKGKTVTFALFDNSKVDIKNTLSLVYDALEQKGYNATNQIVGYILSEDPTYITTYKNARALISKIDRDELLQVMVEYFLKISSLKK